MKTQMFTLAVALTLAACGDSSSPVAPTPTLNGATNWLVTQRFGSVTGPDNCWVREQRARWTPAVFPDLEMTVTRADTSITLKSDWFQVNYTGRARGDAFSATGDEALEGGGGRCADGTLFPQMPGVSRLSGRFVGDQALTATEVNTYVLVSGGTVTYTWEWQARRAN